MRKSILRQIRKMFEPISQNMLAKRSLLSFLLVATILIMAGSSTVSYGQSTLSVQAKNVSNDSDAASIDFG
ncbi:MAG TPA: hypothetical protein VMW39_05460, partial [bacterium]|nr:hypothetical protein [bacterium]